MFMLLHWLNNWAGPLAGAAGQERTPEGRAEMSSGDDETPAGDHGDHGGIKLGRAAGGPQGVHAYMSNMDRLSTRHCRKRPTALRFLRPPRSRGRCSLRSDGGPETTPETA